MPDVHVVLFFILRAGRQEMSSRHAPILSAAFMMMFCFIMVTQPETAMSYVQRYDAPP